MLCVLIPLSGVDSAIVSGLLVCRRTPLCHCPNVRLPVKTAFQRLPVFHHNCTLARTTTRVHCLGCIWLWSDQIHDQDSDQTRSTIKRSQLITNAHMSSYLQHFWTGQNNTFLDTNNLMIFLVWTVPKVWKATHRSNDGKAKEMIGWHCWQWPTPSFKASIDHSFTC